MSKPLKFSTIRRRNQLTSFLLFFTLVIILFLSLIKNPWYKIPVDWYFIPVLGFVGSILLPTFFGRHYCGQYCPSGFISDSLDTKNRAGKFLKSRNLRYVFILLFFGIFAVSFSPFTLGLPVSMTSTYWDGVINKLWILWLICPFLIALPLIFIVGKIKGGRTWCNYMCPWGTIGVALGKEQLVVSNNCSNCKECIKVCPQPEVIEPVLGTGGSIDKNCLLCLRCVDICPQKDIITFK